MNDFVGFWDPSWGQVGGKLALKIDGKWIQKGLGVSTSLWGRSRRLQSGPGTENIDFKRSGAGGEILAGAGFQVP